MAQHDFLKLSSQGRAYDATRAWTEQELLSLEELINHGLERLVAAEYVRNGINSVALYEASKAAGLEPKSLEVLRTEAISAHQEKMREELGALVVEEKVVVEPEVIEPEVVAEATADVVEEKEVVEPEVIEPEAEPKAEKSNKRGGKNK